FSSPGELAAKLAGTLGPLEIALTFRYLHAPSSGLGEAGIEKDNALRGWAALARDRRLLIARRRMQALRWANQSLRDPSDRKLLPHEPFPEPHYVPVLKPADKVPTSTTTAITRALPDDPEQRRQLRPALVRQFIKTERAASSTMVVEPDSERAPQTRTIGQHGLDKTRDAALRPLTPEVIDDFIAVEHPSAFIDGAYASVITTLRGSEYPSHL